MFELKHIDKSFRDREDEILVANDLSWSVGAGDNAALMGESGAGKTTLMNILKACFSLILIILIKELMTLSF